jgi:hypothetical protein
MRLIPVSLFTWFGFKRYAQVKIADAWIQTFHQSACSEVGDPPIAEGQDPVTVQAKKWRNEKNVKNVEFGPGPLVQNLAM